MAKTKPRKVRSFREQAEFKAVGPFTANWLCRSCGQWNRQTVSRTPQQLECACGRPYRATVTNTTLKLEAN